MPERSVARFFAWRLVILTSQSSPGLGVGILVATMAQPAGDLGSFSKNGSPRSNFTSTCLCATEDHRVRLTVDDPSSIASGTTAEFVSHLLVASVDALGKVSDPCPPIALLIAFWRYALATRVYPLRGTL